MWDLLKNSSKYILYLCVAALHNQNSSLFMFLVLWLPRDVNKVFGNVLLSEYMLSLST